MVEKLEIKDKQYDTGTETKMIIPMLETACNRLYSLV